MGGWLGRLLGVDLPEGGRIEGVSVRWSHLETPFHALIFLLALAALSAGVWALYRKEPPYVPPKRKNLLAGLRAAGLAVLLLILAGPVLEGTKVGSARSKVAVLIDLSQSMSRTEKYMDRPEMMPAARAMGLIGREEKDARKLSAGAEEKVRACKRLDLVRALFDPKGQDLAGRLRKDFDIEVFTFARARDLARLGGPQDEFDRLSLENLKAEGAVTELGGALRAVQDRLKGQPLAGVVLLSDGAHNQGEEPSLAAAELTAPLYPVGIGLPAAKDIAISRLFVEGKVFKGDAAPVTVRLRNRGFRGERVELVARMEDEEVARASITLGGDGEQSETLRVKPSRAGRFKLRIEATPLAGDCEPANNGKERQIEVLEEKIRVLILEEKPRWEYRHLVKALSRDRRVRSKIILRVPDLAALANPGSPFLAAFPEKGELFKYDVILFGDFPNDSFWSGEDLRNIERFVVEEGGGIFFFAGKNHLPDAYFQSPLKGLFPVEFEPGRPPAPQEEWAAPSPPGFRVLLTPEGRAHSLTRFQSGARGGGGASLTRGLGLEGAVEADTAALWNLLPNFYTCHQARQAKPGALVLAVQSDPEGGWAAPSRQDPVLVLVTAQIGRGRVIYSATADWWRMRSQAELGPDALEAFYGHAVQYLGLLHRLGGGTQVEFHADQEEYAVSDPVKVSARILDARFNPSQESAFPAVATLAEDPRTAVPFTLSPVPGQAGHYQGQFVAPAPGALRITLKDGPDAGKAYHDVTVRIPQLEMDVPEMNLALLESLARTSRGREGKESKEGRVYGPDEVQAMAEGMRRAERKMEARIEDPLWDAPLMLILFTLFLGAEWFIRKRSDLV